MLEMCVVCSLFNVEMVVVRLRTLTHQTRFLLSASTCRNDVSPLKGIDTLFASSYIGYIV